MGFELQEIDDSDVTVSDVQFMIESSVLENPKTGLHYRVKTVDYEEDYAQIHCIENGAEHTVALDWIKHWKIL